MNNSQLEKIRLEHEAAKIFMRHYEQITGMQIRHIWHNQPSKPDVSCLLDGVRLDIEIAHLYGSEQEAMSLLGRELTQRTRMELRDLLQETDMHLRLIRALNHVLASKATKHYTTGKVWLVIRNAHPSWGKKDFEKLQSFVDVPAGHPFEQIWLVADMKGESGIYRLYPLSESDYWRGE